jgi:hypothetical protein
MTDPTQQPDDMMGFLNRLAMKVLEAPISQRELMYEDIRQDMAKAQFKLSWVHWLEWSERVQVE